MEEINCDICGGVTHLWFDTENDLTFEKPKNFSLEPKYCNKCLEKFIYDYKTKYKPGFTVNEIKEVVSKFNNVSLDTFYEKLGVNTCMVIDGQTITYHCDILTALICCLEDREKNFFEFD